MARKVGVFARNDKGAYCFVFNVDQRHAGDPVIYKKWGPPTTELQDGERLSEAACRAARDRAGVDVKIEGPAYGFSGPPNGGIAYFGADYVGQASDKDSAICWLTPEAIAQSEDLLKFLPRMRTMGLI